MKEQPIETKEARARGGRPRRKEPCTAVCTWLPADAHDLLIQRASRAEMSVSAYLRRVVFLTLEQ